MVLTLPCGPSLNGLRYLPPLASRIKQDNSTIHAAGDDTRFVQKAEPCDRARMDLPTGEKRRSEAAGRCAGHR